jgi:arylsulfatase A-like enzyme
MNTLEALISIGRCMPVALATVAALTIGCVKIPDAEISAKPHPVIIIDIDTLRADHLGCYGYHRDTSPAIDAFAAQAVVFEHAFSQAPNTPPSQTSILTGLYPSTHGMIFDEDKVPDAIVTLAEALSEQDFITAGFHDGGYMSQDFNIGQGFQTYESFGGKGLARIGPKVMSWVAEHAEENFLLLIHTYDTHTPYAPPEPYRDLFLDGLEAPSPGFEPTPKIMEAIRLSVWTDEPQTLPENDMEYARALYDGGIRYVDTWVGQFLDHLNELGLDERATVVLISDHGEEFQEHGSVLHEKLYSTVTRVPLIIRLSGDSPHRRITEVVETIDLMPTILELVGAPQPPGLQGSSLVPLLRGRAGSDGLAFGESPFFGHRRFVATGVHQLLLTKQSGAVELYNFVDDRHQQADIALTEPETTSRLEAEIAGWEGRIAGTSYRSEKDAEDVDPQTLEQLRELGYIQD